jgi:F0F1-type ATP synthase membrane subunit c/vacuolar-type H+-ATPase subunit K
VAAWPLAAAERRAKLLHQGLTVAIALLAIGLGIDVMAGTAAEAWLLF